MTNKPKPRWGVGHVHTGKEASVCDRAQAHGCEVYLPVVARLARLGRNRNPVWVDDPLLPGYLFFNFDTIADPRPIYDADGFRCFISVGGLPALVCDKVVDKVREIEGQGAAVLAGMLGGAIQTGDTAEVLSGPFRYWSGPVVKIWGDRATLDFRVFTVDVVFADLTVLAKCA